jgi:hypothetical protein
LNRKFSKNFLQYFSINSDGSVTLWSKNYLEILN